MICGLVLLGFFNKVDLSTDFLGFFRGWAFCCFETALIIQLPALNQKVLTAFLCFAVKFTILGVKYTEIFTPEILIGNILFGFLLIYPSYISQKRERTIFESFFRYRQEHFSVKSLFDNFSGSSITVLNSSGTEALFSNKASFTMFSRLQHPSLNVPFIPPLDTMRVDIDGNRDSGSYFASSTAPEGLATLQDYISELFRADLTGSMISLPVICLINEDRKLFEVRITSLVWEKSNAVVLIITDVSFKDQIATLKFADENKDRLIATVSHELRTPLSVIRGILDIAMNKGVESDVHENLSLCKDSAEHLLSIVNSLLDFQQLRHGSIQLNPTMVDVRQLLKNITGLFNFTAAQKEIYIKAEIHHSAPSFIYTDGNRVKQILINLVGNALKFTSKGGITLKVAEDPCNDKYVKFSVCDTGVGLKEDQKKKLFKKFTKIDDPRGYNRQGVGLGLSIADTLSRLLKEDEGAKGIEVASNFGVGSEFSFTISKSLRKTAASQEQAKEELSPGVESNKETLLLEKISSRESGEVDTEDYDELVKPLDVEVRVTHYVETKKINLSNLENSFKMSKCASRENLLIEDSTRHIDTSLSPIHRIAKVKSPSHFSRSSAFRHRDESPLILLKGTALLVDDNPFNIFVAKNTLEIMGYIVETAMDGESAIRKMKELAGDENPPKFVLMDCQMPIMDGFEVTKILKEMMKNKEIGEVPIIALTANDKSVNPQIYKDAGMVNVLNKPLMQEDLNKVLSSLRGNGSGNGNSSGNY